MKKDKNEILIDELRKYYNKTGKEDMILKAQDMLCEKSNYEGILLLVSWFGRIVDIEKCGKAIINSKDVDLIYSFAEFHAVEDKQPYFDVIAKSGDVQYNYLCLDKFKVTNKKPHFDAIIKSGDAQYNFLCLKNFCGYIEDEQAQAHFDAIAKSGDAKYNSLCLGVVYGVDAPNKKPHFDAILKSGNPEYIVECLIKYHEKLDNPKAYLDAILKSGNAKYIYKVLYIEGADRKAHLNAVLKSGNVNYIYECLKYHFDELDDPKAYIDAILKSGDAEWNFECALKVQGADKKAHLQVMKKNGATRNQIKSVEYLIKKEEKANKMKRRIDDILLDLE